MKGSGYKRVLLKISGEALKGNTQYGLDPKVLDRMAYEIGQLVDYGVQVGVVIGGGNLFRGEILSEAGLDRITGDQMGILATLMNSLAMRDALERAGFATRVFSAVALDGILEVYNRRKAIYDLNQGRVVFFAGGTGNPLVTTDSAASLRAIEVGADLLIKATKVDGIYSADPVYDPQATLYEKLTYSEALEKNLEVMDASAFSQCREFKMPLCVFNLNKSGALLRIAQGKQEGTFVQEAV